MKWQNNFEKQTGRGLLQHRVYKIRKNRAVKGLCHMQESMYAVMILIEWRLIFLVAEHVFV